MVLGRTFLCFSFRCLSFGSFLYSVFKVPSPSSSDGFADRSASGDGEIRTLDPLLARQVLSQLSYAPILLVSDSLTNISLLFPFVKYLSSFVLNPAATCSPMPSPA